MVNLQEVFSLSSGELEDFRRVSSQLLSHTFILRSLYGKDGKKVHRNPDYLFVQRHFDEIYAYFSMMNWSLILDDHHGYCYLRCEQGENRLNLTKDQTALFVCLRLIYEEKMEDLGQENDVIISVQEILDKLIGEFGILKSYSKQKIQADLSLASQYRIIQKVKGALNSTEGLFAILPTILTAVDSNRLHDLVKNLQKREVGEENESTSPNITD